MNRMSKYLDIDGSILEGGGQILRISIALSAVLGVPVRVSKIRAGRSKPGLGAQHLKAIQLVAEMCEANANGTRIGSTEVEFSPGKIKGGNYVANTGTAGSVSLLLQAALPCALMADGPTTLELIGGTNAEMAPPVDFMTEVFRHTLRKFGADFSLEIHRRGYYPKGGGRVIVKVMPITRLYGVSILESGVVQEIWGKSFVSGILPVKMAQEMADGAKQKLLEKCDKISIECYKETKEAAPDNCCGIMLWCKTSGDCVLGSDGLVKRGADAFQLGREAAQPLCDALDAGACVDSHVQDQMILYMALATGPSRVRVGELTLHLSTAIHVAEKIAQVKFNITNEGRTNLIECSGVGSGFN